MMSFNYNEGLCVFVCVCECVLHTPIGNSEKSCSIAFTGLPGILKGKQIFSNPVTSWTVPLPALKLECKQNLVNQLFQEQKHLQSLCK